MNLKSLFRRLRRRYREPVIKFLFQLFCRLPRPITNAIGYTIGWLLWVSGGKTRHVTEVNVRACFPELSQQQQQKICKESLLQMGRTISELPLLWTTDEQKLLGLIKGVEGVAHLEEALKNGKGVICLTPHLGAWEIMGLYLSIKYPMTTLYRPPQMSSLEEIMIRGRTRFGVNLVPTDAALECPT